MAWGPQQPCSQHQVGFGCQSQEDITFIPRFARNDIKQRRQRAIESFENKSRVLIWCEVTHPVYGQTPTSPIIVQSALTAYSWVSASSSVTAHKSVEALNSRYTVHTRRTMGRCVSLDCVCLLFCCFAACPWAAAGHSHPRELASERNHSRWATAMLQT